MKICIDIQPAVSQCAGIGRYTSELVNHLPADTGLDFELFYLDFKGKAVPPTTNTCTLNRYSALPGMLIQQAWKRLGWPRFDKLAGPADLYHFTNFIIPPLSPELKTVVSIHDISFLLHPEFTEQKNLDYLSKRIKATTERADAIITISQQSARDISTHLQVPTEKIHPIYLGVSDKFAPGSPDTISTVKQQLNLSKPYILMVGTFEPRKNIIFAVELFEKMKFFDGDLVIVGQPGWKNEAIFKRIRESGSADRIRTFTALPDNALPSLYSGASFLLMTSFYEGFGFPPVEAMACGTPVLSSTGGSLQEICNQNAVLVQGWNQDQWLEKAQSLLSDTSLRETLIHKGLERSADFKWSSTVSEHLAVYRKVLK